MSIRTILIPATVRRMIEDVGAGSGQFSLRVSGPDRCGIVIAASASPQGELAPFPARDTFLQHADTGPSGTWYRGDDMSAAMWSAAAGRGGVISVDELRGNLPGILPHVGPGTGFYTLVVTGSNAETPMWTAWAVTDDAAFPVSVDVERDDEGLATLGTRWPTSLLESKHAAIVGVGSIGSAAAAALAECGLGTITLIDPDRLEFHNLVRHQLTRVDVGRSKTLAMAERLRRSHPTQEIIPRTDDVVTETDAVRDAVAGADVIIGATDGVLPRRTIVHLSRRLGRPAVLGCVLLDGAVGEIMRFRPVRAHGCLECRRRSQPGLFNLDSSLDAPYGEGSTHLPMTALGADLTLVGRFLAKTAVSTILEPAGMADQRLPGETALIGLRPTGAAPAPYDLTRAGEVRWLAAQPPIAGCPTCDPAA